MKRLVAVIIALIILLLAGVAVTKLTVRDLVSVDERVQRCVAYAVNDTYDNPIERIALFLGESRIITADRNDAGVESFTLFRIPLGVLRGQPDMTLGVICDQAASPDGSGFISATNLNPQSLVDGMEVEYLGTFHDSPIENALKSYQSERLGISFLPVPLN